MATFLSAARLRIGFVLAATALALLAAAPTSNASTSSCYYGPSSQPFAPWGDLASYTPVPGGTFESGAPGWTLAGGARVVSGNESYRVTAPTDSHSLAIPTGGPLEGAEIPGYAAAGPSDWGIHVVATQRCACRRHARDRWLRLPGRVP